MDNAEFVERAKVLYDRLRVQAQVLDHSSNHATNELVRAACSTLGSANVVLATLLGAGPDAAITIIEHWLESNETLLVNFVEVGGIA